MKRQNHCYARAILAFSSLLCSLALQAQDIYLWGTANGTRFYLKVESPVNRTVQIHAGTETTYTGEITIPEIITAENVKEVYVYDTNPRGVQGTDPFELIGPKATLYVPYGTEEAYKTLYGWKDFTVKPFLILDESKTFEVTSRIENIRTVFKRNIKSGTWNSFCIPFDLSADDVQTVFGSGTRVLEFDPNSTESTLNFVDVTSISASKPYLIKPSVSWSTYTFESLTVDPSAALTVSGTNYDFTGSYSNGYTPAGSYFISSNKFYRATDDTNVLKGYRAYLTPANKSSGAKSLTFSTSETTRIGVPVTEGGQADSDIYSMDGRLVRRQAASFERLAPGLYIQNKKKILIK
ncbi:MAG: hypothetical protein MSD82_08940 [Prevotella sp.]|nr:hypothetical protein [Prevotella sp.]